METSVLFYVIQILDISQPISKVLDSWIETDNPNLVTVDRISHSKTRTTNDTVVREIIEEVPNDLNRFAGKNKTVFKLTLRDEEGNYCYAYEYNDQLEFLRHNKTKELPLGIPLGSRLIVQRGTIVAHGALLLNNACCKYLGMDENNQVMKHINTNIVKKQIKYLEEELKIKQA